MLRGLRGWGGVRVGWALCVLTGEGLVSGMCLGPLLASVAVRSGAMVLLLLFTVC